MEEYCSRPKKSLLQWEETTGRRNSDLTAAWQECTGAQSGGTVGRGRLRYCENKRWEKTRERKPDRERKHNTALRWGKLSIFISAAVSQQEKKSPKQPVEFKKRACTECQCYWWVGVMCTQAWTQPAWRSAARRPRAFIQLCIHLLMCHHSLRETSAGLQRWLTAFQSGPHSVGSIEHILSRVHRSVTRAKSNHSHYLTCATFNMVWFRTRCSAHQKWAWWSPLL